MAAHGRKMGRAQGKRLIETHGPVDGLLALQMAIEAGTLGAATTATR
jgi:hypothetical protein